MLRNWGEEPPVDPLRRGSPLQRVPHRSAHSLGQRSLLSRCEVPRGTRWARARSDEMKRHYSQVLGVGVFSADVESVGWLWSEDLVVRLGSTEALIPAVELLPTHPRLAVVAASALSLPERSGTGDALVHRTHIGVGSRRADRGSGEEHPAWDCHSIPIEIIAWILPDPGTLRDGFPRGWSLCCAAGCP